MAIFTVSHGKSLFLTSKQSPRNFGHYVNLGFRMMLIFSWWMSLMLLFAGGAQRGGLRGRWEGCSIGRKRRVLLRGLEGLNSLLRQ